MARTGFPSLNTDHRLPSLLVASAMPAGSPLLVFVPSGLTKVRQNSRYRGTAPGPMSTVEVSEWPGWPAALEKAPGRSTAKRVSSTNCAAPVNTSSRLQSIVAGEVEDATAPNSSSAPSIRQANEYLPDSEGAVAPNENVTAEPGGTESTGSEALACPQVALPRGSTETRE